MSKMEEQLLAHRYQVLSDVSRLHQYAQTTKQHQERIADMLLVNGLDDPRHSARQDKRVNDLIKYLEGAFLKHTAPDIKPKLKTRVSYDGIHYKSCGKPTKSKDAYEKSWIQQGYDYFKYYYCPIERKEGDKVYKLLGWVVN